MVTKFKMPLQKFFKKQWGKYYLLCYQINKNLAVMHGEQIKGYLSLIPKIILFCKKELESTETLEHILTLLETYPKFDQFMRISKVIDFKSSLLNQEKQKLDYKKKITMFKNQLLIYQRTTSHTILSINSSRNSESFYDHILFNYYPYLVDKLWREYKVSLGVFNL